MRGWREMSWGNRYWRQRRRPRCLINVHAPHDVLRDGPLQHHMLLILGRQHWRITISPTDPLGDALLCSSVAPSPLCEKASSSSDPSSHPHVTAFGNCRAAPANTGDERGERRVTGNVCGSDQDARHSSAIVAGLRKSRAENITARHASCNPLHAPSARSLTRSPQFF